MEANELVLQRNGSITLHKQITRKGYRKMEYDGWTRKLTIVLREWGFEPTGNKSTSHKKWRYEGPKTQRAVTVAIPANIKSSSRAVTIASIRKNLRRAGASNEAIAEFNKYALGLIEAVASDPLDELEEKLAAAITNEAALAAAKIAFQLAKTANDKSYESQAIKQRDMEISGAKRKSELVNEIEEVLLTRMKGMFNRHIEAFGRLNIGGQRGYYREKITIDAALADEFGFLMNDFDTLQYNHFRLRGNLTGETAEPFNSPKSGGLFEVILNNEYEEEFCEVYDGDCLYGFSLHVLQDMSEIELKDVLATLQSQQTMMALAGRIGPVRDDL